MNLNIRSKNSKNDNYGIRKDYSKRVGNEDYYDGTSFDKNIVYQPNVYELAGYLAQRTNAEYIIDIGAGNGEKIKKYLSNYQVIAVDCDVNLDELKRNLPNQKIIEYDLEKGVPKIPDDILARSIVISSDVIEHIVDLSAYLKGLADYSKHAPFVLISTPDRSRVRGIDNIGPPANKAHVREWTSTELDYLLNLYGLTNIRTGYTINTNVHQEKSTILCIGGKHNLAQNNILPAHLKSVLAIMTVFNEQDIVEHTIKHLLKQGLDVHIIDNWSTDKSSKIIKKIVQDNKGRVFYEKFPKKTPTHYEWIQLLDRIDTVASKSNYDWIIHHDADEIRRSPSPHFTLRQAISLIDALGYNTIDHTVLDFRPVDESNPYKGTESPEAFFNFFEFGCRPGHFSQTKGWKNDKKSVNLADSGGHVAKKTNQRVYPLKFITKHYPLRSPEQAKKKIFIERKPRINKLEQKKGWHHQYNQFSEDDLLIWDKRMLRKFHQVRYWQEYMVEQISGIGISRGDV